MSNCRFRVLAGQRDGLQGEVLAHPSGSLNPDTFGDGSG